uniref:BHLH domain-containing protein n=1 Tax=Trichuris muris TaxID=70415 RepID=A0A5S6R2P5_TRIMR
MNSRTHLRLQLMREQAMFEQQSGYGTGVTPAIAGCAEKSATEISARGNSGTGGVDCSRSLATSSTSIILSQPIRFTGNRLVHLPPQIIHVNPSKEGDESNDKSLLLSSSLPSTLSFGLPTRSPNASRMAGEATPGRSCTPKPSSFAQSSLGSSLGRGSPIAVSPAGFADSPQSASFTSAQSELDDLIINEILSMEDDIQKKRPNQQAGSQSCSGNLESLLAEGRVSMPLKVSSSAPSSSEFEIESLVHDEALREQEVVRDRRKKDIHNMIERRRRYNINDRIKELSTLLPKSCTEEMKLNKGTILKASVEYIRHLRKDQDRLYQLLQKQLNLEQENKRLQERVHDLEKQLVVHPCGSLNCNCVAPDVGVASNSSDAFSSRMKTEPPDTDYLQYCYAYVNRGNVPAARTSERSSPMLKGSPLTPDSVASSDCSFTGVGSASFSRGRFVPDPVFSRRDNNNNLNELMIELSNEALSSSSSGMLSSNLVDPLLSESRFLSSKVSSPEVQWDAATFSPEPQEQMDFSAAV